MSTGTRVVVAGQVARDLVLQASRLPRPGGSAEVIERREVLGGKGANQAVGLAQLGVPVALVGVVGEDAEATAVLARARADGIDVTGVLRRGTTALLVDLVDAPGSRRLLEHVPDDQLLRAEDVRATGAVLAAADTLVLQLQQPQEALLQAVELAPPGARVVLDGAIADTASGHHLLMRSDVVRADAVEAAMMTGRPLRTVADAVNAAERLLRRGPSVVALAVPDEADVVVWEGGTEVLPLTGEAVDPTGGGDAFVAGLVAAVRQGAEPSAAGRVAAACARVAVGRLGGRPALSPMLLHS